MAMKGSFGFTNFKFQHGPRPGLTVEGALMSASQTKHFLKSEPLGFVNSTQKWVRLGLPGS